MVLFTSSSIKNNFTMWLIFIYTISKSHPLFGLWSHIFINDKYTIIIVPRKANQRLLFKSKEYKVGWKMTHEEGSIRSALVDLCVPFAFCMFLQIWCGYFTSRDVTITTSLFSEKSFYLDTEGLFFRCPTCTFKVYCASKRHRPQAVATHATKGENNILMLFVAKYKESTRKILFVYSNCVLRPNRLPCFCTAFCFVLGPLLVIGSYKRVIKILI